MSEIFSCTFKIENFFTNFRGLNFGEEISINPLFLKQSAVLHNVDTVTHLSPLLFLL